MKRKSLSILLALVLVLSFSLITAVPVSAAGTPAIDGTVSAGEWDGALEIPVADGMGTVKLLASTDYLYVLVDVLDSDDARLGQTFGNDQTSININPTPGDTNWGKPCDIIFQIGADPGAWGGTSSGNTDGWETDWEIDGVQQMSLPGDLETMTVYSGGTRISEWKIPLATINPAPGDILDVAGAIDVGDQVSHMYPPELGIGDVAANWGDLSIYVDYLFMVENETTGLYYQTIQGAIDVAQSGDTVNVEPGTYTEAVVVNKNLTLQGENRNTTEIKFGYGSYPSTSPLTISADGVIVSGLTIRSGPYIEVSPGAFTIVVEGNSALLTDLDVIKEPCLDPNAPIKKGAAVFVNPGVNGFSFTDSTVDSDWNGIYAREDGSNIVVRNVDFTYPGEYAILLKMITGATIEENTFTGTADQYGVIVTRGSSGIEIVGNEFIGSGSSNTGILLQAYATGTMGDVTILGNGITDFNTGILVEDVATSGISIHSNNITGNAAYGVNYLGSDIVNATNNWWGSPTGPQHTSNPAGNGDIISDGIKYGPWYIDEARTTLTPVYNVTSGTYHHSIQAGINAASDDDTIEVAAGTYNENILIGKPLTVKSTDGAAQTIIDGTGSYIVDIRHSDVMFDGFTVTNPDYTGGADASGILIQTVTESVNNVRIVNNIVTQVRSETGDPSMYGATGINIGNAPLSNIVISGNIITDIKNPDGASVDHTCGINVWDGAEGVVIANNTISDIKYNGIILQWASNVQIAGNSITGCETGIRVEPFVGATVSGYIRINNIVGNEVGVQNLAEPPLSADYNWWGSVNGPGQDGANDVLGDVDYSPWLPGEWETYYDLEAEELIDSDGDGFSDLDEYWLGTDHTDPESLPGAAIDPDEVDTAYVEGDDQANLQDSEGDPIADVDISGAPEAASGTITGARYTEEPEEETGLSVGTGTTGVAFLDVKVTGYTEGIARITVPYPDAEPSDGIVDSTTIDETTLGLYYWDEATSMWLIADNNVVDTVNNNVSGDIPVSALAGTPVGMGGYLEDEAAVAIESILNLSYSGEDTVYLTIDTNTAFLGAATIDLTFDPRVVEVIAGENSAFDTLTVNLNYAVIGNDTQIARFVAHQEAGEGVDATESVVVAVVKLNAVGSTMDESPLELEVITLKDNEGDIVPFILGDNDSIAIVGGIGDADRDGVVDAYDCVYIARAIAGFSGYSIDTPTMNVSGDLTVDAWDCTYLARYLVKLPGYPLGG